MKKLDPLKKKKIALIIAYFIVSFSISVIDKHSQREVFVKEDIQTLLISLGLIILINIKYIIKK